MRIARRFKFEAAHALPFHDGACRRLHGHSYRLELILEGAPRPARPEDPQSGFIVDFGLLDQWVRQGLIDPHLDHRYLNDGPPGLGYPSAERLAAWIMGWCLAHLETRPELGGARMALVRLWETENAWVEAEPGDALPIPPL